jgi:hypothetical protein
MHQCSFPLSYHPPVRIGSATGAGVGEHTRVRHCTAAKKKVKALFAELKNQIGLRRLRLRRLKFVREQFFLAAVAQNIKRLVRLLSQPTTPTLEAAT